VIDDIKLVYLRATKLSAKNELHGRTMRISSVGPAIASTTSRRANESQLLLPVWPPFRSASSPLLLFLPVFYLAELSHFLVIGLEIHKPKMSSPKSSASACSSSYARSSSPALAEDSSASQKSSWIRARASCLSAPLALHRVPKARTSSKTQSGTSSAKERRATSTRRARSSDDSRSASRTHLTPPALRVVTPHAGEWKALCRQR
jgi:hypothetical protein